MEIWENEKLLWEHEPQPAGFPQLLRVLSSFHECFFNSIETQLFSFFRKHIEEKKKESIAYSIIKLQILFARAIVEKSSC